MASSLDVSHPGPRRGTLPMGLWVSSPAGQNAKGAFSGRVRGFLPFLKGSVIQGSLRAPNAITPNPTSAGRPRTSLCPSLRQHPHQPPFLHFPMPPPPIPGFPTVAFRGLAHLQAPHR